jgi:hypothetical protein
MKSIVLVALLWTGLAAASFAQDAEADFQTDGEGTITRYVGWSDKVVIPARIGGKRVGRRDPSGECRYTLVEFYDNNERQAGRTVTPHYSKEGFYGCQ